MAAGVGIDDTGPVPIPFPRQWVADAVLTDGGTVHVRPIIPGDAERIQRFHERQSPESIYFRFFSPRPRLSDRDVERFTTVDYVDRMAFVGLLSDDIIGVARYDRHPARSDAEVAFFTDDQHQGRGVATVLLEYLAAAARDVGISGFTASVLPQNRRMLSVFKQAGFAVSSRFADGIVEVELAIEPTADALALMEARARQAGARSVERLLAPRSIAVVGASRQPGTVGHNVFRNLIDGGFEGPVYPVNSEAEYVSSVRTYPSVLAVPDDIDLAVVAVPAEQVLAVVEECAYKRVRGLVVLSAGFAESGEEGAALERRVVDAARRRGMRVIGPNGMGVVNTAPRVRMRATFAAVHPRPGPVGFGSQSGTIGAAVLERATALGLGVSTFVAVGNKADVSGNDLLRYWSTDDRTEVVLLYLESFGNPKNFTRIARDLAQRKPIVAVKSGRALAPEGAEGADDGVGWPAEVTVDALLRQAGVIRLETIEQVFDVCQVLVHQPLPPGPRVAVLSNAWGPAVLCVDACVAAGLELASVSESTKQALAGRVRSPAPLGNPVELTIEAGPAEYGAATRTLLADPGIDAVLVLYAPPLAPQSAEVARAVAMAAAERGGKPVVATMLGAAEAEARGLGRSGAGPAGGDGAGPIPGDGVEGPIVPRFAFPESAAHALGRVAAYAQWRRQPHGEVPDIDGLDRAAEQVGAWLADHPEGGDLDVEETAKLLGAVGIGLLPYALADDGERAVAAAQRIGYPVALKATGLVRLAKTEAGGVSLDVHGDDEVRQAHARMVEILGPVMHPALVQAMGPHGPECGIGVHQHPALGSVVTFGPGALAHETVDQLATRILPLTDTDVRRLVESSTVGPAVVAQGEKARAAVEDLLLRVAALADAVPDVALVRLNPVIVSDAAGVSITDARVRLRPWPTTPEPAIRRLS